MSKEHRIPLMKIRCMTNNCYKKLKLKKLWQGLGGKPLPRRVRQIFLAVYNNTCLTTVKIPDKMLFAIVIAKEPFGYAQGKLRD